MEPDERKRLFELEQRFVDLVYRTQQLSDRFDGSAATQRSFALRIYPRIMSIFGNAGALALLIFASNQVDWPWWAESVGGLILYIAAIVVLQTAIAKDVAADEKQLPEYEGPNFLDLADD